MSIFIESLVYLTTSPNVNVRNKKKTIKIRLCVTLQIIINKLTITCRSLIRSRFVLVADPNCLQCVRFSQSVHFKDNLFSQINLILNTIPKRTALKYVIQVHHVTSTTKKLLFDEGVNLNQSGWLNLRIQNPAGAWFQRQSDGKSEFDVTLQVTCIHCQIRLDDDNLPVLGLSTYEEAGSRAGDAGIVRQRRSMKCSNKGFHECCLDSFYVPFNEILGKMSRSLIIPDGLNIGQCHGGCDGGHVLAHEYAALIHKTNRKSRAYNSLCCVPVRYRPTNVILSDTEEGSIYMKQINELVVTECGCV